MLRAIVSATLCVSLSLTPCFGQQQQVPLQISITDGNSPTRHTVLVKDLEARARAGDGWSGYMMGSAAELGLIQTPGKSNINFALEWYRFAADHGSWNASYRLGYWMKTKTIWEVDAKGNIIYKTAEGEAIMQKAVANGFDPSTDRKANVTTLARTQAPAAKSSADDSSAGLWALLGIGLVAAIVAGSSRSSDSTSTSTSSQASNNDQSSAYTDRNGVLKQCTVGELHWVSNSSGSGGGHDEFQYVHHMGSECP